MVAKGDSYNTCLMRLALWLLLCSVACGAQELSPESVLLARIKVRMAENLRRLPNYTCLQTIERSARNAATQRYRPVDILRMEVALVGGKELFAWPGEQNFEEKELREIATSGAMGNGNFALHARSVFLSAVPTFKYTGRETREGREVVSYEYKVPQFRSGFQIRSGKGSATVGYHGKFWADARTLDLIRLQVEVENIPPALSISAASDQMDYRRIKIGDADFLLPESSELVMIDASGTVNRNRTHFSGCRQYAGESVVSFSDPPPNLDSLPVAPTVRSIDLPLDVRIQVALKTPVQFGKSAVGDVVTAVALEKVKHKGKVLIPKGAIISGRVSSLEKASGGDVYVVGLDFHLAEFPGTRARFHSVIQRAGKIAPIPQLDVVMRPMAGQEGVKFFVQAPRGPMILPAGYLVLLRTVQSNSTEDKNKP